MMQFMIKTIRYHIQLNSHRTTISLDKIVADLLAIKLEARPRTKEAHSKVRKQLEQFIAHDLDRDAHNLSRYMTEKAVLFISDKSLSTMYTDVYLDEIFKIEMSRK